MLDKIYENFQEVTSREQIYPACLPTQQRTSTEGVQSGWSKPMPKTFLSNHASGFLKVYDEFYKQVQYKMTAFFTFILTDFLFKWTVKHVIACEITQRKLIIKIYRYLLRYRLG